ncbi:MAG: hypothetical protein AMS21_06850 [Gemmatimonas sp. SG8_38_2]|nr:MAG: hypothetical protein AMS21_06850 [Gemmatimonas sp. SG8_38_2]
MISRKPRRPLTRSERATASSAGVGVVPLASKTPVSSNVSRSAATTNVSSEGPSGSAAPSVASARGGTSRSDHSGSLSSSSSVPPGKTWAPAANRASERRRTSKTSGPALVSRAKITPAAARGVTGTRFGPIASAAASSCSSSRYRRCLMFQFAPVENLGLPRTTSRAPPCGGRGRCSRVRPSARPVRR